MPTLNFKLSKIICGHISTYFIYIQYRAFCGAQEILCSLLGFLATQRRVVLRKESLQEAAASTVYPPIVQYLICDHENEQ